MQPILVESNSFDTAPTDTSIASKPRSYKHIDGVDTTPTNTSIALKPRSYKLIDIEGDNADTELYDKSQETVKSVDNHVEKSIKHLPGEVSRMALAIASLVST